MIDVEEEFPSSRGYNSVVRPELATKSSEIIDDRSILLLSPSKRKRTHKKKIVRRILPPFNNFSTNISSLSKRKLKCLIGAANFQRIWNNQISRVLSSVGISFRSR